MILAAAIGLAAGMAGGSSDAAAVLKEYQKELIHTYPVEEQEAVKMELDYYFEKLQKNAEEQTLRTLNLSVYLADYK